MQWDCSHFNHRSFEAEFQSESSMENSTKIFIYFFISIGIQFTSGCVSKETVSDWIGNFYVWRTFLFFHLKNDYGIALKTIENCAGDQQVIQIDTNSSVSLSENCELLVNTCGQTKGFETAQVCYGISIFKGSRFYQQKPFFNSIDRLKST